MYFAVDIPLCTRSLNHFLDFPRLNRHFRPQTAPVTQALRAVSVSVLASYLKI